MTEENKNQQLLDESEHKRDKAKITVTVELHRHGAPVENVIVLCDREVAHDQLAEKLATVLALEVEDLVEEFTEEHNIIDVNADGKHSKVKLECIDVHFETESATHHFLARMKWKRVHQWASLKFKIAKDVSANLELRDGSPDGTALNESKPIGVFAGCRTVWLVKPGPEPNGR